MSEWLEWFSLCSSVFPVNSVLKQDLQSLNGINKRLSVFFNTEGTEGAEFHRGGRIKCVSSKSTITDRRCKERQVSF